MRPTKIIYPSADGPLWLPVLTPEGSPRNIDQPSSSTNSRRDLRNFKTLSPSPSPSSGLPELDLDFLRRFGTPPDDSGAFGGREIHAANSVPSVPGSDSDMDLDFLRRFGTPPADSGALGGPEINTANSVPSVPGSDSDMDLDSLTRFGTPPGHSGARLGPEINERNSVPSVPGSESDVNRWRRFSSPVDDPWSVPSPTETLEEERTKWRCFPSPLEESERPYSVQTDEISTIASSLSMFPTDGIEISSSPPTTPFPLPIIPCRIASEIQLPIRGSALDLGRMPIKPSKLCDTSCCEPVLLSTAAPTRSDEEIIAILKRIPCPSNRVLENIQLTWANEGKKSFEAIEVHHSNIATILPSWVLNYWQSVATHWTDIVLWSRAYNVLNTEVECQEILDLLSTIPWQGRRSPIPGAAISDLATLATTAWLSDNQINLLGWFVNQRIESETVRLVQAAYPDKMRYFFMRSNSKPAPLHSPCKWLDSLREQLRAGKYEQIGFCVHAIAGGGLPTAPGDGNHWVSIVVDGKNRIIWFGDSLGNSPHRSIIEMVKWWLRPAFGDDFSIRLLRCVRQTGPWSCGDRAINMIAHHFAPEKFALIGRTKEDALRNRFNLLVRIVDQIRSMPGSNFWVE